MISNCDCSWKCNYCYCYGYLDCGQHDCWYLFVSFFLETRYPAKGPTVGIWWCGSLYSFFVGTLMSKAITIDVHQCRDWIAVTDWMSRGEPNLDMRLYERSVELGLYICLGLMHMVNSRPWASLKHFRCTHLKIKHEFFLF
jgi:hypothetical protein